MTVDPSSLSERSQTLNRSELEMTQSEAMDLSDKADVDEELIEEFDL
jgi:hypothetical protein